MQSTVDRCWGCGRVLEPNETPDLCASCEASGVQSPTRSHPIGLDPAPARPGVRGQRVVITGVDMPLTLMIDLAFKLTLAFLITSLVIGIPIGIVVWLILSAT